MTANCITVDFEEWFHGLTSTSIQDHRWHEFESRIEMQTRYLLDVFSAHSVTATFFVVGEIARTNPGVLEDIAAGGHEIALHGDRHRRVDRMSEAEFKRDTERNLAAVTNVVDVKVEGYRAAYMSVNHNTPWAWSALRSFDLDYDSSVFPIRTPLYGMPGGKRFPHTIATDNGDILEIPISTALFCGKTLPFSGGVWLRNLPYPVVRKMTASKNVRGEPVIFYVHPWEFDPAHPQPDCTTLREKASHYSGLRNARSKLERLLNDFEFTSMRQYATDIRLAANAA